MMNGAINLAARRPTCILIFGVYAYLREPEAKKALKINLSALKMVTKAGLVKYIMNTVSYWFICKFM